MSNKSPEVAGSDSSFNSLKLPSMTPLNLIRQFGPGMILMMTGIGTSHLVTAPVAGMSLSQRLFNQVLGRLDD